MWPPYTEPKKIEPKPKPTKCTFADCDKPPWDELTGLCLAHQGYHEDDSPPRGGKAAGAAFELDEEPMTLAVGR